MVAAQVDHHAVALDLADTASSRTARCAGTSATPALDHRGRPRGRGVLAEGGPLVVDTGKHTGRSADDKFVVREPASEERIWWGKVNKPLEPGSYERLRAKVAAYLGERDLYVVDAFAGADPAHRIARPGRDAERRTTRSSPGRCSSRPSDEELATFAPEALVLHAPGVEADPASDGTRTGTFIALHPTAARGADRRDRSTRARSRSRSSR